MVLRRGIDQRDVFGIYSSRRSRIRIYLCGVSLLALHVRLEETEPPPSGWEILGGRFAQVWSYTSLRDIDARHKMTGSVITTLTLIWNRLPQMSLPGVDERRVCGFVCILPSSKIKS